MALAERRPTSLGFSVSSTPASPAFTPNPVLTHSGSSTSINLDIGNSLNHHHNINNDLDDDINNNMIIHNNNRDIDDLSQGDIDVDVDLDEEDDDDNDIQSPISILQQSQSQSQSHHQNEKSSSPEVMSPSSSRSISPDSLMQSGGHEFKKLSSRGSTPPTSTSTPPSSQSSSGNNSVSMPVKKPKNPSRAPIATGISTTIPVTGEKPRPDQKDDPSLEDDVLYAIFVILYEKDPEGSGMTVKQICDILIEQHPDMANLSTKTSNLVSAKLNAYVKRVEKGDTSLKYALSRDWADASPKRMVYVYRGILAEDFHIHVKKLMEIQKQEQALKNEEESMDDSQSPKSINTTNSSIKKSKLDKQLNQQFPNQKLHSINDENPLEAGKHATLSKPRRQTMYDLGISKNTFMDATSIDKSSLLFVPYNSAPVTASLTESSLSTISEDIKVGSLSIQGNHNVNESDFDFEDFEVFHDDDDEEDEDGLLTNNPHFSNDLYIESFKKNGKRSKSLSYLSLNKKSKILTAAAAAPRAPRTPSSHSANAAAAAADLHAAALRAISNPSYDENDDSTTSTSSSSTPKDSSESSAGSVPSNKKWLDVIRSGFLSLDIGAPEDISLSDLDKFFN